MEELFASTRIDPIPGALLSLAAPIAVLGLWLWTRSLPGGPGLLRWGQTQAPKFSVLSACFPVVLAVAAFLPWWEEPVRRALSLSGAGLGLLVAASFGVLFLQWRRAARHVFEPTPRPRLIDPAGLSASEAGRWRVVFSSDPHFDAPTADPGASTTFLRWAAASRVDAFVGLGDFVERGLSGWGLASRLLAEGLGRVPFLPVLGNHDALMGGHKLFLKAFPRGAAESGSPWYFNWDVRFEGKVVARFFVLHLLWGTETFDKAQRAWLTSTLADTPAEVLKIALSHCFFASSGSRDPVTGMPWYDHPETLAEVAPILEKGGVRLVVSGHNHDLEELERNGVRYAVVGGMGGRLAPQPSYLSPFSIWKSYGTLGGLDLEGTPEGLVLTFRDYRGNELHRSVL